MKRDERKKEMLCTTVLGPLAGRIAVRLAGRYVDTLNHLLFRQAYQWNFPCSPHQKNTSKEELLNMQFPRFFPHVVRVFTPNTRYSGPLVPSHYLTDHSFFDINKNSKNL